MAARSGWSPSNVPVGDAPLLPPSPAGEWPLALPPGATWASLELAVRALLDVHRDLVDEAAFQKNK
jgi:hypothetical protein